MHMHHDRVSRPIETVDTQHRLLDLLVSLVRVTRFLIRADDVVVDIQLHHDQRLIRIQSLGRRTHVIRQLVDDLVESLPIPVDSFQVQDLALVLLLVFFFHLSNCIIPIARSPPLYI